MLTRRAILMSLATFLASLFRPAEAGAKAVAFDLANVPDLARVGGSAVVVLKDERVLLIRDSERTVLAFSAICTHKKRQVFYDADDRLIRCPEHKSAYSMKGATLEGPARSALRRFPAKIHGNRILVKLD